MDDEENSEFKMRLDGESPEAELQQEVEDSRISKLNQRVTLISILIPCFFVAIIGFLYLDAKKEVTATFNSGSQEIQNLSKKIDERFSETLSQTAKREDDFNQKMTDLAKTIGDLTQTVAQHTKTISKLDSSKATKKSVSSSVVKLTASMDALSSDLKNSLNQIKVWEENLSKETTAISDTLEGQKLKDDILQTDLSRLSTSKIDRNDLQASLADQKKAIRQDLDQQLKNMENKLISLQTRLDALTGGTTGAGKQSQKPSNKTEPVASVEANKTDTPPADEASQKPSVPQQGTIIEQDIQ